MLSFILSCKQNTIQYQACQMEPMNFRNHSIHTALNYSEIISYTQVPQSIMIRPLKLQELWHKHACLKSRLAKLPVGFSKEALQIWKHLSIELTPPHIEEGQCYKSCTGTNPNSLIISLLRIFPKA